MTQPLAALLPALDCPYRRSQLLIALIALLLGSSPAFSAGRAMQPPLAADSEFHFVVLGDSQFHDPPGFNRMLTDLRALGPAFVIQVGDMISGYAGIAAVQAEWQRFFDQLSPLRAAAIPFLPVAGNHDLYGPDRKPTPALLRLYEEIWGAAYYRFDYRNAAFIILNSDEPGAPAAITGQQLRWLRQQLADSASQTHRFVFLHRPITSLPQADALHALFREHRVHTVFYGHHHHSHLRERDGVRYQMTNATANSGTDLDGVGSFDHLLQVSVRDQTAYTAIIRADSIESPEQFAAIDNYDLFALKRGLVAANLTRRSASAATDGDQIFDLQIALENTSKRAVQVYLHCDSADQRWQFTPQALPAIALPSGASETVSLVARHGRNAVAAGYPVCTVRFPFQLANGQWHTRELVVEARADALGD